MYSLGLWEDMEVSPKTQNKHAIGRAFAKILCQVGLLVSQLLFGTTFYLLSSPKILYIFYQSPSMYVSMWKTRQYLVSCGFVSTSYIVSSQSPALKCRFLNSFLAHQQFEGRISLVLITVTQLARCQME